MLYHCFASFQQLLLDFFKLVDSQLILMLLYDSINLIVSGIYQSHLGCWGHRLENVKLRGLDNVTCLNILFSAARQFVLLLSGFRFWTWLWPQRFNVFHHQCCIVIVILNTQSVLNNIIDVTDLSTDACPFSIKSLKNVTVFNVLSLKHGMTWQLIAVVSDDSILSECAI